VRGGSRRRARGQPVTTLHPPIGAAVDHALVQQLRVAILARLREVSGLDRVDMADQRQLVRSWIAEELGHDTQRRMHTGLPARSRTDEAAIVLAVEAVIWGLGRLQALLDLPDVEDIHITGSDPPILRMSDGSLRRAPHPVAESDDDLIQQIQHIAAHHGHSERAFSAAQPTLNMRLPDGSRLAAMRDVVPRPTITIRRHRLVDVTLGDLVRGGMVSAGMGRFLQATVQARRSLLVTGNPAVGKTTLLRALAREISAQEKVATIETEFELDLHLLPHPGPLLIAMEARPGSTEIDPVTGRRAGEMTLSDLLHQTLRMSVTRVIVGEVRGDEALPMLEAMNAGMPGSMCTLHAGSAADAFERLVTAALKGAGRGWSDSFVTRLAAQGIDYVIHVRHVDHPVLGGKHRFVSEIAELTGITETGSIGLNRVFAPEPRDPRGRFQLMPQIRAPFDEAGLSLQFLHERDVDSWASPTPGGFRRAR
jgi:pilus assembly protein CpaF